MIRSKNDLKKYLKQDQIALNCKSRKRPRLGRDEIWKFEILLRKYEYYENTKKNIISKILYIITKYRFHKMSVRLGFSIPTNVFEEGLSIAHYGTIVVNENARIGKNCRIHENVTIGSTGGDSKAPQIGDNVFIASGARVIGDITIGNDIAIGANSFVNKDFEQNHITVAGVPARKISDNGSENFIKTIKKEI